jgi:hypothetical protein
VRQLDVRGVELVNRFALLPGAPGLGLSVRSSGKRQCARGQWQF